MKRLLVVRLSALGDVIHTIPAVIALRDHFEIDWVVESAYRELVEIVAGVRAKPVSLKRFSVGRIRDAYAAVRKSNVVAGDPARPAGEGARHHTQTDAGYDVAIDFQGLIKSALLARASGARERFGFSAPYIREKPAAWFLNRHVDVDPSTHVVEWNLQLARACIRPAEGKLHAEADFGAFAIPSKFKNRIALLPGAGRPEKQWPVERFRHLAREIGPDALVVWGHAERELAEAVGAELAPPTNLRELAGVLRDAKLVIGGDTGPLHLASALGTPVIGLYGPTNPARNGPYGQIERCVSTFATTKSMQTIEVADVMGRL